MPQDPPSRTAENGTFRFLLNNDILTGSDDYFSNGWILSWDTRSAAQWEDLLPGLLSDAVAQLPFIDGPGASKRISLSLSQLIFTPEDIDSPDLVPDDVPYAGALLAAVTFSAQDRTTLSAWQVVVGFVGPASFAEETQKLAHEAFHSKTPQGWAHQLDDEFIVNLYGQIKHKFAMLGGSRGWGFEVGGVASAAAGNLTTQVNAALEVRTGWRMPPGFDPDPFGRKVQTNGYLEDQVEHPFSFHLFASAAVRGWVNFIFLDGNTWKESHDVEKNAWSALFGVGLSTSVYRFRLNLEFGALTVPIEGRGGYDGFGGLTVAYTF